jgi:hypothetical protein
MKTFLKIMLLVVFSCCATNHDIENSLDCTINRRRAYRKICWLSTFTKVVIYQRTRLLSHKTRTSAASAYCDRCKLEVLTGACRWPSSSKWKTVVTSFVITAWPPSTLHHLIYRNTYQHRWDIRSDGTLTYNDLATFRRYRTRRRVQHRWWF